MHITTIPARQLNQEQMAAWRSIQRANSDLSSPHFCPEFVALMAEVRDQIEVAVLADGSGPLGFFPFFRDSGNVGHPVAGRFSDFQGIVCPTELEWDPLELLQECGLAAWFFDHLLTSQEPLRQHHLATSESLYMDLSSGFEAYRQQRQQAGSNELREVLRKSRKIEREVAPLRFEPYSQDEDALDQLIRWKRQQLESLKLPNCFAERWVLPMLQRIASYRSDSFSGMLSTVHVGDELLAVNLGMRSEHVMHGWVTAFNRKFRKYSPGLILIVKLAQAAESLGLHRIDMGRGGESFKKSFGSGAVTLAEGAIDRRLVPRMLTRGWIRAKELVRGTSLHAPASRLVKRVRYAWLQGTWLQGSRAEGRESRA